VLITPDIPTLCIQQAAQAYHVPAALILSILKVEGGKKGTLSKNTNGTYDYGPMQINTVWLDQLKPYGITSEHIRYDVCANIWVGTWILSQHMNKAKDIWRGIANYHSFTTSENKAYQWKVWQIYQTISHRLSMK
jgi:soluble lytic murein transglycosylase-like protein